MTSLEEGLKKEYLPQKMRICTFFAFFSQKIWSYQKKAVPLHSLFRRSLSVEQCTIANGAVVQLVRIPACHAVGREFESRPHRLTQPIALFLAKAGGLVQKWGPLAQLNRVPHYGCGGCRFESCTDHIARNYLKPLQVVFLFIFGKHAHTPKKHAFPIEKSSFFCVCRKFYIPLRQQTKCL